MASDISGDIYAETFAAMSAAMLEAAEMVISELKKGVPDRIIMETKKGKAVVCGAGPKALLVVMISPGAMLSPTLAEMERATKKIKKITGGKP
ncbi:MAG: roadblock/LC7 domain-containing protein [Methanocellales archaeon]|nr:roadblock/LC7 domain-containing protein [Methanocellales archaeon]